MLLCRSELLPSYLLHGCDMFLQKPLPSPPLPPLFVKGSHQDAAVAVLKSQKQLEHRFGIADGW